MTHGTVSKAVKQISNAAAIHQRSLYAIQNRKTHRTSLHHCITVVRTERTSIGFGLK